MEFLYQVGASSANSHPGADEHDGLFWKLLPGKPGRDIVGAESTCLVGSVSLVGMRGLAGSSDPAKRVAALRGGASPAVFEEDPSFLACPGSIPPT